MRLLRVFSSALFAMFLLSIGHSMYGQADAGQTYAPKSVKVPHLPTGFSVLESTVSPNRRYGVMVPDVDHWDDRLHQNKIVELQTGHVFATINADPGFITSGRGGPLPSRWSRDSSWLLWEVEGKWTPRALMLIQISSGRVVRQIDVRGLIQDVAIRQTTIARRRDAPKAAPRADIEDATVDVAVEGEAGSVISFPLHANAQLTTDSKEMYPETAVSSDLKCLVYQTGRVNVTKFTLNPSDG